MPQRQIPSLLMRGGTSRGLYFLASDLPEDDAGRDRILVDAMGSPDPRQIDGIGGGTTLTSKAAVISPSHRDDADVNYLFAQIDVHTENVDVTANCGNILAGVGPFAILRGLVEPSDPVTTLRVFNVNTQTHAILRLSTPGGEIRFSGDTTIDGMTGAASAIHMEFLHVLGPKTGKVFPTGSPRDTIEGVPVTCVDSANPVVLMHATDLGETGHESPETLDHDHPLLLKIERIRCAASEMMGLGDARGRVIPKVALLSPPVQGHGICSRYFTPKHCHEAHALTGAIAIAVATTYEGTVAEDVAVIDSGQKRVVTIEHPSGHLDVTLRLDEDADVEHRVTSAELVRTARPVMDGLVFVPAL